MATFIGPPALEIGPRTFNGLNGHNAGGQDFVLYTGSKIGINIDVAGGGTATSPRYTDNFANLMYCIEAINCSKFSDVLTIGYDLSRGTTTTVAAGTPFERHFFLSLNLGDGNDTLNLLPRLPVNSVHFSRYDGGYASFDGANVSAGRGNDIINGGTLRDQIDGGEGNDTINGGGGNDLIVTGNGVDRVNGGEGDDDISVNTSRNVGNTVISGDAGKDRITLSSSFDIRDVIRINSVAESTFAARDSILYFDVADDLIDLRLVDANENAANNQAFKLVKNFTGKAGELQYDYKANGGFPQWTFTGDVNGDGAADFGFTLVIPEGLAPTVTLAQLDEFILL